MNDQSPDVETCGIDELVPKVGGPLTVGQVATMTGLSIDTLRWYERVGLLETVARDHAGRRQYARTDLRRLAVLMRLRATGMPISEMLRYAELAKAGDATEPQRIATAGGPPRPGPGPHRQPPQRPGHHQPQNRRLPRIPPVLRSICVAVSHLQCGHSRSPTAPAWSLTHLPRTDAERPAARRPRTHSHTWPDSTPGACSARVVTHSPGPPTRRRAPRCRRGRSWAGLEGGGCGGGVVEGLGCGWWRVGLEVAAVG